MDKPDKVLEALKAGKYSPLYFLQGDEPYYIDLITDYIEENALNNGEKGFNQTVIYGKDVQMKDILSFARRFPVMSERQTVIVREAQEVSDFNKAGARKLLESYIEKPVPSTVLVFAYKYKKLDGKTKLAKSIAKHCVLVESKKIYDNALPGWIEKYFKSKQLRTTPDASYLLAESIGNDLSRITNEIDKMLLNIDAKSLISADTISTYIGISREYNVFELQRVLGQKNVSKAYRMVNYFAENPKEHPVIPIIASLYSYFCKVLIMHQYGAASANDLAKKLKVNPFFIKEYNLAKQKYSAGKILKIIHYLREADLQSKGINSTANDAAILKELVFKILH